MDHERTPTEVQTVKARHGFEERAVAVFAVVLVATAAFGVLAVLARSKSPTLFHWDVEVSDRIHRDVVGNTPVVDVMRFFSFIGTPAVWWFILGLVTLWLLHQKLYRLAAFVVVTTAGSSLLNHIAKVTVDRARPHFNDPLVNAVGKSFPSGHAQSAVVGYGVLLAVFVPLVPRRARKWVIAAGVTLALAIGVSRIALGAHFVSDVIGGYLAGGAWLLGMGEAFRTWRRAEGEAAPPLKEGLEPEHEQQLKPSGN